MARVSKVSFIFMSFAPPNPMYYRSDSKVIQKVFAVAPVIFNLHEQFQMTTMAEHLFNVSPRVHADLFQARRAVANDNFLLRSSLDKDRAIDAREVFAHLLPFLGYAGGDV